MMAVGLGEKEVAPFLEDFGLQVRVACVNSPSSTTLSGDTVALKAVKGRLEENNIFVRFLHTGGKAYHSHMSQYLRFLKLLDISLLIYPS